MSEEDCIFLSASTNAGAGTVEGRAFNARRMGDQIHGRNTTKENEEIDIGRRHGAERLYRKELVYCTISHAHIGIPGILEPKRSSLWNFFHASFLFTISKSLFATSCLHSSLGTLACADVSE